MLRKKTYPYLCLVLAFAAITSMPWGSCLAVPEAELSINWRSLYSDWQKSHCKWSYYLSGSGKKSGFAMCGQGRRPIVILPGYSEPALKYMETVHDLMAAVPDAGPIFVWELPGQGTGDRLGYTPVLVHVDKDFRYIDDFLTFWDTELKKPEFAKPVIVAHSTGALVAFAASERRPDDLAGIMALSPLVRPNLPMPVNFVYFIAKSYHHLGFGEFAVWGQASRPIENQKFETNKSTDSTIRWNISHNLLVESPQIFTHGISWDWLKSMIKMGGEVLDNSSKIKTKIQIIKPEKDFYVDGSSSESFCKSLSRCSWVNIPGDKHETLQLVDKRRDEVLTRITDFLKQ
jgi:alpha-beta hydrolase superfamily lysophospholipase